MRKAWYGKKLSGLTSRAQTFTEIIETESLYVDKTEFLAQMISDANEVWFLARPRGFGKTLSVSTLETIFSGRREYFKGLYVEKLLAKKEFAPRPVIHLDMSILTLDEDIRSFKESLGRLTARIAETLSVKVDQSRPAGEIFINLIEGAAENSGQSVAILIDEYDAPFIAFMNRPPEEKDKLREALVNYYAKLKSMD